MHAWACPVILRVCDAQTGHSRTAKSEGASPAPPVNHAACLCLLRCDTESVLLSPHRTCANISASVVFRSSDACRRVHRLQMFSRPTFGSHAFLFALHVIAYVQSPPRLHRALRSKRKHAVILRSSPALRFFPIVLFLTALSTGLWRAIRAYAIPARSARKRTAFRRYPMPQDSARRPHAAYVRPGPLPQHFPPSN